MSVFVVAVLGRKVNTRRSRDVMNRKTTEPDGQLFSGANHICIVTADLDSAVRRCWDRYRIGPWRVFSYDGSNMKGTTDGEDFEVKMRAALAPLGATFRIEIIEPLDERSVYAEALRRRGGADHVHHVRLDVPDFERTRRKLMSLGIPVRMDAQFAGGSTDGPRLRGIYFDATDYLGCLLEIADVPPGFSMPEPDYVYPSDAQ
ncbi:MAG: VOC family protein [Solirubrobacterales bacterium]|nr:VOC family protein [Solirubrobacterales bacterium]